MALPLGQAAFTLPRKARRPEASDIEGDTPSPQRCLTDASVEEEGELDDFEYAMLEALAFGCAPSPLMDLPEVCLDVVVQFLNDREIVMFSSLCRDARPYLRNKRTLRLERTPGRSLAALSRVARQLTRLEEMTISNERVLATLLEAAAAADGSQGGGVFGCRMRKIRLDDMGGPMTARGLQMLAETLLVGNRMPELEELVFSMTRSRWRLPPHLVSYIEGTGPEGDGDGEGAPPPGSVLATLSAPPTVRTIAPFLAVLRTGCSPKLRRLFLMYKYGDETDDGATLGPNALADLPLLAEALEARNRLGCVGVEELPDFCWQDGVPLPVLARLVAASIHNLIDIPEMLRADQLEVVGHAFARINAPGMRDLQMERAGYLRGARQLAGVMRGLQLGHGPNLKKLFISESDLSDGATYDGLAAALEGGKLPKLETLSFLFTSPDKAGDYGRLVAAMMPQEAVDPDTDRLVPVPGSGLPHLKKLVMTAATEAAMDILVAGLEHGYWPKLAELELVDAEMSEGACLGLFRAFAVPTRGPALISLKLVRAPLTDEALLTLADGIGRGYISNLSTLIIEARGGGVTDASVAALMAGYEQQGGAAALEELGLNVPMGEEGARALMRAIHFGALPALLRCSIRSDKLSAAWIREIQLAVEERQLFPGAVERLYGGNPQNDYLVEVADNNGGDNGHDDDDEPPALGVVEDAVDEEDYYDFDDDDDDDEFDDDDVEENEEGGPPAPAQAQDGDEGEGEGQLL